ncbi:MAG: phosphatidate cytidylyltransferase [Rhodoglobus sp.]|jgi:phosphatidate cytidylyltransferase|nr:phosphatidate cytidylyltransferase [Rhodoglobus sp.]
MASDFETQARAANDKINARTGRPLLRAIGVGLLLGGSLLVSLLIIKELYMVFAGALVAFVAYELATALRSAGRDVPRIPTVVAAVAVVPATFYWLDDGHWWVTLGGIAVVGIWRLVELVRPSARATPKNVLLDLGAGAFILIYVAFMAGFTVLLTAQDGGQWWTLAFLIVVVAVDTGAYASGLAFGKHLMAPTISPKKTWEGFAGSVAAALIAGILLAVFMLQQPWWVGVILALAMVLTATSGDLAESLIKRDLGIKDISSFLPGHGGFLDRLDSALLSGAVAYALFLIFT